MNFAGGTLLSTECKTNVQNTTKLLKRTAFGTSDERNKLSSFLLTKIVKIAEILEGNFSQRTKYRHSSSSSSFLRFLQLYLVAHRSIPCVSRGEFSQKVGITQRTKEEPLLHHHYSTMRRQLTMEEARCSKGFCGIYGTLSQGVLFRKRHLIRRIISERLLRKHGRDKSGEKNKL